VPLRLRRSALVVDIESWCDAVRREELFGRLTDDRRHVADEAVDVAPSRRLVDDVLVVVVAQAAAQLLVVHLGFVLARAPAPCDLVRVTEAELPLVAGPRDVVLTRRVEQKLQQKLPQLDWTAACT